MINKEKTHALMVSGDDVINSPLVEVRNKYVDSGERFFQVPINKAKLILI